jgi:hypothetical protein
MFKNSLIEYSIGCFYNNEKISLYLWDLLLNPPKNNEHWKMVQNECYQLLVNSIDANYQHEYRLTDIRALLGKVFHDNFFHKNYLPWLDTIIDSLLKHNGDYFHYKESRVQEYVRLSVEIDPTLLLGWKISDWIQQYPHPSALDVERVITSQTPFFSPSDNPLLPFAEGHVHLGGITSSNSFLEEYLFYGYQLNYINSLSLWKNEQFQKLTYLLDRSKKLISLILYPFQNLPSEINVSSNKSAENIVNKDTELSWKKRINLLHDKMFNPYYLPDWELLYLKSPSFDFSKSQWLLGKFSKSLDKRGKNTWLWLYVYLCYRYQSKNTEPLERVTILCFWQTINALRQSIIMSGQGLTRFAEHYYASLLRDNKSAGNGNIQHLFVGRNDVAEVKIGINSFSNQLITRFSQSLIKHSNISPIHPPYIFGESEISSSYEVDNYLRILERWHLCGHFSRSVEHKKGKRVKVNLQKNWSRAEKLLEQLSTSSSISHPIFLGGKSNPNFNFQPQNWFRGLDVAGDENDLKIAGFSPMIRWLRNVQLQSSFSTHAKPSFHLSIHAGEDYAHPISGLRHIDETVRFCNMHEGDRLGHALALGIEPAVWIKRQGEMLLPIDEHLDNLVWLWHYATILSGQIVLAQQVIPILERRISRFILRCDWCQHQYLDIDDDIHMNIKNEKSQTMDNITPDILFRAWLLRRNCYYKYKNLHNGIPLSLKEKCALPDFSKLKEKNLVSKLYMQRHSFLSNDKEPQLVLVHTEEKNKKNDYIGVPDKLLLRNIEPLEDIIKDEDTLAEIEFINAVQDYLMNHYDNMGIIIEANPTSNVYIARLKKYSEHPIFRWNPPNEEDLNIGSKFNKYGLRKGPIKVLINTDDPGIMPTTLRTEYLLLQEAAIERGVSRTTAETWLDRIRQYGMEEFNRNHFTVFNILKRN